MVSYQLQESSEICPVQGVPKSGQTKSHLRGLLRTAPPTVIWSKSDITMEDSVYTVGY